MKLKSCLTILLILLIVPVAGLIAAKYYYDTTVNTPNDGSSAQVIIEIPLGSSVKDIAKQLKDEDIIENETVFEYYIRFNNLEGKLLAGTYETKGNQNIPEVVQDLQNPIEREVRVTLPEGLMYIQTAERLDKVLTISPNWSKEEFLELAKNPGDNFSEFQILSTKPAEKSLEGFLFPDTYIFDIEISTKDVIRKMLENTETRISGQLLTDIEASDFTVYEVLNFAAMIERETRETEDRYIVGDVLYKRYVEGWALGIDATLLYEHDSWKYVIRQKDIETPTPYNTRIHKGLPPTPICSPGLESIKGFVYREANDYYYYVSDSEGNIYYARTWSEHQKNIQKYLR